MNINQSHEYCVVLSGATSGVGRATALALAALWQQALHIVPIGRDQEKLDLLIAEVSSLGAKTTPILGDLSSASFIDQILPDKLAELMQIDVLIVNAGVGTFGNLHAESTSNIAEMIAVNVNSTIGLTKAALPHLTRKTNATSEGSLSSKAPSGGQIVFVGSDVSRRAIAGGAVYAATKYAQTGFAESIRKEVHNLGIRVSMVYPGLIDTAFHSTNIAPEERQEWLKAEDVARVIQFIVTSPPHVVIDEIMVHPRCQAY